MRVAFLDLDHTLLAADSNQLWMSYLQSLNLVAQLEIDLHEGFMNDYANGMLDFAALQSFRIKLDEALPSEKLNKCKLKFQKDILLPAIAPLASNLLADLRQRGLTTVVVSATRDSLVVPVAQHLNVSHAICSCFGLDKVHQVDAWLGTFGCSLPELEESWFYTDSHTDLPLLDAVMYPVAVDPDLRLKKIALNNKWPILSLRV